MRGRSTRDTRVRSSGGSVRLVLLGIALGVLVEGFAWLLRWWEFRRKLFLLVQVVGMYGLVMGGLAAWVPRLGPGPTFGLACLLGLCSELLNVAFLKWWRFCDGRDDSSWGRLVVLLVLALAWGAAPLVIARTDTALVGAWRATGAADPFRELEARKRHLLVKREALLARLREVDHRLRALDRREQRLLERRTRRTPGRPRPEQEGETREPGKEEGT